MSEAETPDEDKQSAAKKGARKGTKRVSQLRRPSENNLSNPALSGIKETVSRSYIGQGNQAAEAEGTNAEATQDNAQAVTAAEAAEGTVPAQTVKDTKVAEAEVGGAGDSHDAADAVDPKAGAADTQATEAETEAADSQGTDAPTAKTDNKPAGQRSGSRGKRKLSAQQHLEKSYTESVIDLAMRKNEWATHHFRFTPDLIAQVNMRAAEDSEHTGLPLTSAQYVNAAMAMHLPATLDQQLELAEAFLRDMGARRIPEGQQSSYRVSPDVLDIVRPLSNHLKKAGRARTAYHIYSAVLARYLAGLQEEGPVSFTG